MTDNTEIKTTLVVDDKGSSSVLAGMRKQFQLTDDAQKAAQHGMSFFSQTAAVAAGSYLPQLIGKIKGYGEAFMDAAKSEMSQRTAMTGLISAMQDIPWDQAKRQSTELSEKMDDIALSASRMPDDIKQAFQLMSEFGGATKENIEKSERSVSQLAQLSRVLGTSVVSTAQEYQFMGEGILRTRGHMFQLLQTTGIFGEKTKGAAAGWAKLSEDKRAELLAYGLEKLTSRMQKAPEGFGALTNQMHAMREMAEESLGMPLLNALVPQLRRLVTWMKDSRGSIEEFAKHMADDAGKYAEEAGRVIREGWSYVTSHMNEIKDGIITAWSFAQRVIQFAIEHKEALAIAYGGKMLLGSGPAQAAIGAGKAVYGLGSGGTAVMGASMAGAAGGAAALGAFSAAIVGVSLAAWQASKLMNDLDNNQKADVRARYEFFADMAKNAKNDFAAWDQAATDHFEHVKKKFMAESQLLGMSRGEAEEMANASREQHEANRKMVEYAEDAAKRYQMLAAAHSPLDGAGMVDVKEQDELMATITRQFQAAIGASNSGAQSYIANLFVQSRDLQQAFLASADMTAEGYRSLADLTQNSASEFSEALKRLGDAAAKREKSTSKVPSVQFNGGQTFKIQQDFRDENPDRIAMVFQRDLLASAERRYQSSFASPFGS